MILSWYGTYELFNLTLRKLGINVIFVDPDDPENFRKAITDKTKALYGETLGNPKINVLDIEAVANIAHENKIPLIIDNTFATPYLARPFEFGADVIIHSATKFIGGHGTTIGGIIVDGGKFDWRASGKFPDFTTPDKRYNGLVYADLGASAFALKARVQLLRNTGATLSPQSAFLFLQGLEAGKKFINSVELFSLLANVADAKSLVIHPSSTTHAELDAQQQIAAGVTPDLIRLSIGVEGIDDIIYDLQQALDKTI